MKKIRPEAALQMQIVYELSRLSRIENFVYFSVPNESFMLALSDKKTLSKKDHARLMNLRKMGFTGGASDIVVMKDGHGFCLEVKDEKGEQSESQKIFETWCNRADVPYAVVRSVEETLFQLGLWGVIDDRHVSIDYERPSPSDIHIRN